LKDNSKVRTAFYYKNYFFDFYNLQRPRVRNKILKTIKLIEDLRIVPDKFLKHITGTIGLYEIRVKVGSDIFRIFCFFDSDNLIILINGFQKKTQKTPDSEIKKALQLKSEYENEK
jgi:phage-related protein